MNWINTITVDLPFIKPCCSVCKEIILFKARKKSKGIILFKIWEKVVIRDISLLQLVFFCDLANFVLLKALAGMGKCFEKDDCQKIGWFISTDFTSLADISSMPHEVFSFIEFMAFCMSSCVAGWNRNPIWKYLLTTDLCTDGLFFLQQ